MAYLCAAMSVAAIEDQQIYTNTAFHPFADQDAARAMAAGLTFDPGNNEHPLSEIAVEAVQQHLSRQNEWRHNFGLDDQGEGAVIGKMFGVLAVRTPARMFGYLAAFSGKLANANHHSRFVGPVFDSLAADGFLTPGMLRLSDINRQIAALALEDAILHQSAIRELKALRKNHSAQLQRKLHSHYQFLNKAGQRKNLVDIFTDHGYKQPPAGAGECAGPKLLQYAYRHRLEPLAMTEFWWGLSPKSATWKHGEYYKPCKEKCAPILDFMLSE